MQLLATRSDCDVDSTGNVNCRSASTCRKVQVLCKFMQCAPVRKPKLALTAFTK